MSGVRDSWADLAKGAAIILVVLFHAVIFLNSSGVAMSWQLLNTALETFRMPLFFTVAGLFAAKAVSWPFSDLWRKRLARLVWLYVLWSLIWTVFFLVVPWPYNPDEQPTWLSFLGIFVWPNTSTWFVYALALYFAAAWLMRRLPALVQLGIAIVPTLIFAAHLVDPGNQALIKMPMYFFFFLAGSLYGPQIRQAAPRSRWWMAAILLAVWGSLTFVVLKAEVMTVFGVRVLLSILAVAAGIALAVTMSRSRLWAWMSALGTRTLPVYLLHFYPVIVVSILLRDVALPTWLDMAAPLLLTALAIGVSLMLRLPLRKVPGLFDLPRAPRPEAAAPARNNVPTS